MFQPPFLPKKLTVSAAALDDGVDKWIALELGFFPGDTAYFIVARMDGSVLTAFRADAGECQFFGPSLGAGSFAVPVGAGQTDVAVGAIVGSLATGASNGAVPTLRTVPLSGTPVAGAIVGSRASLFWGSGVLATSVDVATGADEKTIAQSGAIGELGVASGFPGAMIFNVLSTPWTLFKTDGVAPATQYLLDPAADLMSAAFTGAHLVWVRGVGQKPDLTWNNMEIWSAPFDLDPKALTPKLLAAWPFTSVIPLVKGGFDYYGSPSTVDPNPRSVHLWHVPDGEHRTASVASELIVPDFYGVFHDEVIFPVRPNAAANVTTIYRVPISSLAVVP